MNDNGIVSIRLSRDVQEKLSEFAARRGVPVSTAARMAVHESLGLAFVHSVGGRPQKFSRDDLLAYLMSDENPSFSGFARRHGVSAASVKKAAEKLGFQMVKSVRFERAA